MDCFDDGAGHLCIAMELAERGDLRAVTRARGPAPLAEATVLDWFAQIALAMFYMHVKKVRGRRAASRAGRGGARAAGGRPGSPPPVPRP